MQALRLSLDLVPELAPVVKSSLICCHVLMLQIWYSLGFYVTWCGGRWVALGGSLLVERSLLSQVYSLICEVKALSGCVAGGHALASARLDVFAVFWSSIKPQVVIYLFGKVGSSLFFLCILISSELCFVEDENLVQFILQVLLRFSQIYLISFCLRPSLVRCFRSSISGMGWWAVETLFLGGVAACSLRVLSTSPSFRNFRGFVVLQLFLRLFYAFHKICHPQHILLLFFLQPIYWILLDDLQSVLDELFIFLQSVRKQSFLDFWVI